MQLYIDRFETFLGSMQAIANEHKLYVLEFLEPKAKKRTLDFTYCNGSDLKKEAVDPIISIQKELEAYFNGELQQFKTPVHMYGTDFQRFVWQELLKVSYGQTCSYSVQAQALGKPTAVRAVANANGANQLAIIIPCHRIIQKNGKVGGYVGGCERKQWLIEHERRHA